MDWVKEGLIFEPAGQAAWIGTHAALPVVEPLDGHCRVYLSSRDRRGRSHIGFVELSLDDPSRILKVSEAPMLAPGSRGTFDDAGVTSSGLVRHQDRLYLYYTGWSLGVSVPFYLSAGLAVSEDDGRSFRKQVEPLFDRSEVDPYVTASPWVLVEGGLWRMWYVSGTGWSVTEGRVLPRYHIKYAESNDGIRWRRTGVVCIDYDVPGEHAFGRPCVVKDRGGYRMWYSYRGESYRIGYAESGDGVVWTRLDRDVGITVSARGWDSEMITYPLVLRHRDRLCMLYNGNDYGRTGIGLARGA